MVWVTSGFVENAAVVCFGLFVELQGLLAMLVVGEEGSGAHALGWTTKTTKSTVTNMLGTQCLIVLQARLDSKERVWLNCIGCFVCANSAS